MRGETPKSRPLGAENKLRIFESAPVVVASLSAPKSILEGESLKPMSLPLSPPDLLGFLVLLQQAV